MTPPQARVNRPVARHVRLHGGVLAVPAVIAFGVPVILQVPAIGPVAVAEDKYPALYDLLASENPDDWERAYTDLERIQREAPGASIVVNNAPQNSGSTNMLPPGFGIVHPPLTTSSAAPDDNVRDLAEPLSFDGPPPKRDRERGLW
jgi:hypothetical protein